MPLDPTAVLAQSFGYTQFRPGQEGAINAVVEGRDTLVVMPTGAGKSLCFQVPALCLSGITIVVSPLIALMKDQVDQLLNRNVAATFINSTLSQTEMYNRLAELSDGKHKLLYVAPERFYDQKFMAALQRVPISLFAVDEAHCISEWGHDFRPSYRQMKNVIEALGHPPVIALTATATPDVRVDIVNALGLRDPFTLVTGFDRPNLHYGVFKATPNEKIDHVLRLVRKVDGPAIVYAGTRDTVDTITNVLQNYGVRVVAYHAGMEKTDRDSNQQLFMEDKVRVMVATNAFGLGINKPNVRLIVHFDLPGTLEQYYQEAGRAGRDGGQSYATLLYHPSDRYLREFFLNGENPEPDLIREVYKYLTYQSGEVIYTTYREILEGVSMKVPEIAIGTAIKMLESGGYIKRPREGLSEAFLKLSKSIADVEASLSARAKVQLQVWQMLRDRFGRDLEEGINFSPETLVQEGDVSREALSRSLHAFAEKGLCVYEPPFRGQEIRLQKYVDPQDLELDWSALALKRMREEDKLNRMEGYIYTPGCRRGYVLKYLGDAAAMDRCRGCDNCL